MKGIFTYPNNASTHYINPDYVGDATSGFQRRIQELIDGDYANWYGIAPADDVDAVMTGMGKYNKAFQETSGENTPGHLLKSRAFNHFCFCSRRTCSSVGL